MKILSYVLIIALLIYNLFYKLVLIKLNDSWLYIFNPLVLLIFSIICFLFLKKNDIKYFKYKKDIIYRVIISSLIYLMIYYLLGLIFGYSKNPYAITYSGIIINLFSIILVIILKEYLRNIFIGKVSFIFLFICFIVFDINFNVIGQLNSFENILNIIGQDFIPIISINLFSFYLCKKGGFIPSSIYQTIINLVILMVSIIPNYEWIINTLFDIMFPLFTYLVIQHRIDKKEKNISKDQAEKFNLPKWIVTFVVIIVFILFGIGAFPLKPVVILTGSMQPSINPGDMLIIEKTDIRNLKVGDVIQYKRKDYSVVHRIVNIVYDKEIKLILKGDNNNAADKDFVREDQIIGIMKYKIPYIGYPTYLIKNLIGGNNNVDIETGS